MWMLCRCLNAFKTKLNIIFVKFCSNNLIIWIVYYIIWLKSFNASSLLNLTSKNWAVLFLVVLKNITWWKNLDLTYFRIILNYLKMSIKVFIKIKWTIKSLLICVDCNWVFCESYWLLLSRRNYTFNTKW